MDRHQARKSLLKAVIVGLVVSTWIFTSFILSTRPEQAQTALQSADALSKLARLPASLPSQLPGGVFSAAKPVAAAQMEILELPCWDKQESDVLDSGSRWLRLKGRTCHMPVLGDSMTVRNLTNGYLATVFNSERPGELTTDYIPLQEGKNDILVRFETEPGVLMESQFTLIRE